MLQILLPPEFKFISNFMVKINIISLYEYYIFNNTHTHLKEN